MYQIVIVFFLLSFLQALCYPSSIGISHIKIERSVVILQPHIITCWVGRACWSDFSTRWCWKPNLSSIYGFWVNSPKKTPNLTKRPSKKSPRMPIEKAHGDTIFKHPISFPKLTIKFSPSSWQVAINKQPDLRRMLGGLLLKNHSWRCNRLSLSFWLTYWGMAVGSKKWDIPGLGWFNCKDTQDSISHDIIIFQP